MATQMMTVVWIDANGAQSLRTITTNTGASALLTAMIAKSNAVPKSQAEGNLVLPGGTPATAAYLSATQVAYLTFNDGAGHQARLPLVSPLATIFMPDGVSVDATQIAAIIAAATGVLLTGAGTAVVNFEGGQLGPGRITR